MNKYKEIIILLLQLFMFYIFPFFTGPTDGMGMVFVIWLSTIIFSMILVILSDKKIKYLYPIIIFILFIPSVFIHYNNSALVHSVWYLISSSFGVVMGIIIVMVKKYFKE